MATSMGLTVSMSMGGKKQLQRYKNSNYIIKTFSKYIKMYNREMKSAFPKGNKRQSKNQGCNGNAKFGNHGLAKSSS